MYDAYDVIVARWDSTGLVLDQDGSILVSFCPSNTLGQVRDVLRALGFSRPETFCRTLSKAMLALESGELEVGVASDLRFLGEVEGARIIRDAFASPSPRKFLGEKRVEAKKAKQLAFFASGPLPVRLITRTGRTISATASLVGTRKVLVDAATYGVAAALVDLDAFGGAEVDLRVVRYTRITHHSCNQEWLKDLVGSTSVVTR